MCDETRFLYVHPIEEPRRECFEKRPLSRNALVAALAEALPAEARCTDVRPPHPAFIFAVRRIRFSSIYMTRAVRRCAFFR